MFSQHLRVKTFALVLPDSSEPLTSPFALPKTRGFENNAAADLVDKLASVTSSMATHLMTMLKGVDNEIDAIVGRLPFLHCIHVPASVSLAQHRVSLFFYDFQLAQLRAGHQDLLTDVNTASMIAGELAIATSAANQDDDSAASDTAADFMEEEHAMR